MAENKKNTIKNCGEPGGDPGGPYLAECIYEYIVFMDCSNDNTYSDPAISMGIETAGTVLTYASGGPDGGGMYTHSFNDTFIRGTPYSVPIFMGLMSGEWHEWFFQNGRHLLDSTWQNAQMHNLLPFKHRYKMAKYFMSKKTWITQEDVDQNWRCKIVPDQTSLPQVTVQDWARMGFECPPYYKLSSCTDCQGQTKENPIEETFFEMMDGNEFNNSIIEYPINSHDCYDLTKLPYGPRSQPDHYRSSKSWMSQHKVNEEGTVFETSNDCYECKENYLLAINKDEATDTFPGANASLINSTVGLETIIYEAVSNGHLSFFYMYKDDVLNQNFYNANKDEFYYKPADGICRKACFYNPNIGGAGVPPCPPTALANWAKIWRDPDGVIRLHSNPALVKYLHANDFTGSSTIYASLCDCEDSGGTVSIATSAACAPPPEDPPIINSGPSNVSVKVSAITPTKKVTFNIDVNERGTACTYTWYRNGAQVQQGGLDSLTFDAGIGNNGDSIYVTISNEGNSIVSGTAKLIVTSAPECLFCDKKVYTTNVTVYCLNQAEANTLKLSLGRMALPASKFKVGSKKMYGHPNTFTRSASMKNKWWLVIGGMGACKKTYTLYKSGSKVSLEDWEDLSARMRGVKPPDANEYLENNYCLQNPGITATAAQRDFPPEMNIF